MRRDDDRVPTALERGDGVLEGSDHIPELEHVPRRIAPGGYAQCRDCMRVSIVQSPGWAKREKGKRSQSMPAENSFGRVEARTTARMDGSAEIASNVRPSSVHILVVAKTVRERWLI